MLSALYVAFGTTRIFAHTNTMNSSMTEMISIVQDEDVPVELEKLPQAVQKTLASEVYKDLIPSAMFIVNTEEGVKYFEIMIKKEEEMKVVNIDAEGKVIELPVIGE